MESPQPTLLQRLRAGGCWEQQQHRGQGKWVPSGLPGASPLLFSGSRAWLDDCTNLVQPNVDGTPITCFSWCFSFQRGYFITMKVLYTCGYSTSLAALFLAIGIFSCFR